MFGKKKVVDEKKSKGKKELLEDLLLSEYLFSDLHEWNKCLLGLLKEDRQEKENRATLLKTIHEKSGSLSRDQAETLKTRAEYYTVYFDFYPRYKAVLEEKGHDILFPNQAEQLKKIGKQIDKALTKIHEMDEFSESHYLKKLTPIQKNHRQMERKKVIDAFILLKSDITAELNTEPEVHKLIIFSEKFLQMQIDKMLALGKIDSTLKAQFDETRKRLDRSDDKKEKGKEMLSLHDLLFTPGWLDNVKDLKQETVGELRELKDQYDLASDFLNILKNRKASFQDRLEDAYEWFSKNKEQLAKATKNEENFSSQLKTFFEAAKEKGLVEESELLPKSTLS